MQCQLITSSLAVETPLGGVQRLVRELEYEICALSLEQLRCTLLAEGGGAESFDEIAYCTEFLWNYAANELAGDSDVVSIVLALTRSTPECFSEIPVELQPSLSQTAASVAASLTQLSKYAERRLEDCGAPVTESLLVEIRQDICEVRSLAAGMMRHLHCSHRSPRPPSAIIALLLDPAVSAGVTIGYEAAIGLQRLLPAPQPEGAPSRESHDLVTSGRVTSMRQRIFEKPVAAAQTTPASRRSRIAPMTCEEAFEAMVKASPHLAGPRSGTQASKGCLSRESLQHLEATKKLMSKAFGNRAVSTLDSDALSHFFGILRRLPKNHHRSSADNDLSLEEICARAEVAVAAGELASDKVGLGPATVNRHLSGVRKFICWLSGHIELPEISFAQFAHPRPAPSRERGYLEHEVRAIFELPIYTGLKSPHATLIAGDTVWHNALYWVYILIVYSGARLGEICGLLLTDIREVDGIWCMTIRENDYRSLKNDASERDVPLHSEIIRLGFLEFVQQLREEGEELLFPELYSPTGRPLSGGFHELCGKFIQRELPFMLPGDQAHPGRHYVNDLLKLAEISLITRQVLLGHKEGKDEKRRRTRELPALEELAEALQYLPVVTGHLKPMPILLHPKERRIRGVRPRTPPAASK